MRMMRRRFKNIRGKYMQGKRQCACCVFDATIDRAFEKREWQDEVQEEMTDR